MTRRPTALGAYVFAGGFTLGVRERFEVLAHLEGDGGYGASTARANFPGLEVRHGPADWRASDFKGVDWIFTNPPCQVFSQAGHSQVHGTDWRDEPNLKCWHECFGLLEELRPRAWCLESVTQAYSKGRELIDELTKRALALGYSVTHVLEDAQWFGLPQRRQRFLLVCHRPAVLAPHGLNWAPAPNVLDALNEVADPGPTSAVTAMHAAILPHVPPGGSLRAAWERLGKPDLRGDGSNAGPAFLYYRLYKDRPRHALVGNRCFHPVEDRLLGENEMRAVCGFPPDFALDGGNPHENGSLLARGLMPPVAAWLARVVAQTLESPDVQEREGLRVTLLDLREPPGVEADLTAQYLNERGKVRMGVVRTQAEPVASPAEPRYVAGEAGALRVTSGWAGPEPAVERLVVTEHPRAEPGEVSGKFMQRLLLTTELTPEEIVAAVHANWEGRTTKVSDCYFNYKILQRAGTPGLRPWASGKNATPGATGQKQRPAKRMTEAEQFEQGRRNSAAINPGGVAGLVASVTPQPTRANIRDRTPDQEAREYDTTSLTEQSHGYKVHRDYAAHFFRWGFVRRHVGNSDQVLEIGCGADFPFRKSITYPMHVPARYVGVDLNPLKNAPSRGPWTFHGSFNFNERYAELGNDFNIVVSLEVIEHMTFSHGQELLAGAKHCLAPGGQFFLSTPVFDGKAAANHIHEYTIPELFDAVKAAGFRVVERFGTFANQRDLKQVCTPEQWETLRLLNRYYSTDVTACFLAPLYPDASRNNLWVLEHA